MRPKENTLARTYADLRADFRAAKNTRFTPRLSGVNSLGSGMDYHYRSEQQWLHMMERARSYQRNDAIVGQGIRRVVANVVQDGFGLDINTGDSTLDEELKARWIEWATDPDMCHSEGELTFQQMEQMALSHVLVDGDVLPLLLKNGGIQWVEAHRCRTPRNTSKNVVHGVLLDKSTKRREYWFTKEELDPNRVLYKVSDIKAYPARDPSTGERFVLHLYMPYRFSQRRGVTALAPVSDTIGMHDDLQFAQLLKAQIASLIAIMHERGPSWESYSDQQKGARTTDTAGGFTRTIEGMGAGLEIFGDIDEKISAFSANVPNAEFFDHAKLILTFIAINLDLPVAVLLLDPSDTNFSGWRGAIDQARMRFRQIQQWLVNSFHGRVYRWKVRQWMSQDSAMRSLPEGVNVFGHRWNPPSWPYIEPLKDAQADALQLEKFLTSPQRLHAARGRDAEDVRAETLKFNRETLLQACAIASEINTTHPDSGVTFQHVLNVMHSSAPTQPEPEEEPKPAANGNRMNGNRNGLAHRH